MLFRVSLGSPGHSAPASHIPQLFAMSGLEGEATSPHTQSWLLSCYEAVGPPRLGGTRPHVHHRLGLPTSRLWERGPGAKATLLTLWPLLLPWQ